MEKLKGCDLKVGDVIYPISIFNDGFEYSFKVEEVKECYKTRNDGKRGSEKKVIIIGTAYACDIYGSRNYNDIIISSDNYYEVLYRDK